MTRTEDMVDINSPLPKRFQKTLTVSEVDQGKKLFEFLANSITPSLSKAIWKKCISAGSIWVTSNKKRSRIKRVTLIIKKNDKIEVFFDPNILKNKTQKTLPPLKVYEFEDITAWYKPNNMVTQDSAFGDKLSLYSFVKEEMKKLKKQTYLLHRLDRETDGLVLFAHNASTASYINELFATKKIQKTYFGFICGSEPVNKEIINIPIENKESITELDVVNSNDLSLLYTLYPETKDLAGTWCQLNPITGRKHQLRIHLQSLGRPLLHDPRYSRTHKKNSRLYLCAYKIIFGSKCINMLDEINFNILLHSFFDRK